MSQSPENNSEGLISCKLYSDGSVINDSFGVISIWIRKEANCIGIAQIVLEAGNMAKQEIPESESETFAPGKTIRIEAGYKNSEKTLFEGVVTSHSVEINETTDSLIIECRDFTYPMTLSRKNKVFENKTDKEAIQEIMGAYKKLNPTISDTSVKYNELVQYYCSDWDFILSRANLNGMIVITEGEKIQVKPPDLSSESVLTVTYGKDIISFKGDLQTDGQLAEVEAFAWDSTKQKLVKAQGTMPSLNKQGTLSSKQLADVVGNQKEVLQTNTIANENLLKIWASSQLLHAGLARIIGEVKFQGNAVIKVGDLIKLAGLSKRFNGDAYTSMVEHEIKEGNWTTTAGIGISPQLFNHNSDAMAPSASGLLPGIQGMHIGKVIKIHEDPSKENKIQVEIPLLNEGKNKVWARLATFWASNQFGAFFIPDIGDEVVLGFFNNDPCFPVILGSLYSSKQTSSTKIEEKNNIRSILTKSKLKLEFEEEKKSITLTTPANNSIVINDEDKSIKLTDQHQNKIVMNDSGILIESSKSLSLKAKTAIEIEAGTNIDIKAKSALNMKAPKIEAKADISFTANGSAKAELSAGGQTVIKGAMVMIN